MSSPTIQEIHLVGMTRHGKTVVGIHINGEHVRQVNTCKCGPDNFQEDAAQWLRKKRLIGPRLHQESLAEYCRANNIKFSTEHQLFDSLTGLTTISKDHT